MSRIIRGLALGRRLALAAIASTLLAGLVAFSLAALAADEPSPAENAADPTKSPAEERRRALELFLDAKYSDDPAVRKFRRGFLELVLAGRELKTAEQYRELVIAGAREDAEREAGSLAVFVTAAATRMTPSKDEDKLVVLFDLIQDEDDDVRRAAIMIAADVFGPTRERTLGYLGTANQLAIAHAFRKKGWKRADDPYPEAIVRSLFYVTPDAGLQTMIWTVTEPPKDATPHHEVELAVAHLRHLADVYHIERRRADPKLPDDAEKRRNFIGEMKPHLKVLDESGLWYARAWAAVFLQRQLHSNERELLAPYESDEHPVVRSLIDKPVF